MTARELLLHETRGPAGERFMHVPVRRVAAAAAVLLACAMAGAGPVVLHLKSGATIRGDLVREDDESLTIRTPDGALTLARSTVVRIVKPDEGVSITQDTIPSVPEGPPPVATRATPWPRSEEDRVEKLLDRFFAAKDEEARRRVHAELANTRLDRSFEDLERMREAPRQRLQRHVPVPWRKGATRGWYNLALPGDYTPARAWPLVLALHGMPSDGDNLVTWYSRTFPARGYIVLFPTTVSRSSFWPAPAEKRELFRLLRHVCSLYRVDSRRIFCTGASGGGIGTWHWLTTLPDLFAGGISFSAAGTIFDERLKKLVGVPFYVHHGTKDYIPIGSVQRSVAMARKLGATIEFHVSQGTGHTPPAKDFVRAFDWLVKLGPKDPSPRHLLESAEGALPTGYRDILPFALNTDAAEAAKILAAACKTVPKWELPATIVCDDLVKALVEVSRIVDPKCEVEAVRAGVRGIADAVRKQAKPDAEPEEILYALNEVFFQTEGFARDGADPSGTRPEGHAVSRVLQRKAGSVLALVGLYTAVARELKLPVYPVVTPYHAFVRYDDGGEQVNVEMTEAGGHFDDRVYLRGYGLREMPGRQDSAERLVAGELAALAAIAHSAGEPAKARALADQALGLDPACYGALHVRAAQLKDDKPRAALDDAAAMVRHWPAYAAARLLQGQVYLANGSRKSAVDAFEAAIAAPVKPFGADARIDAECFYQIAAMYASRADELRAANRGGWVTYHNRASRTLVQCLKLNPTHPEARELFVRLGGRFTTREPGQK